MGSDGADLERWRSTLTDAGHCPACGAALVGPQCPACGVDLAAPPGPRLWEVSVRAAELLAERERLLAQLRAQRPVAARPPAAAVPPAGVPVAPEPSVVEVPAAIGVPPVVIAPPPAPGRVPGVAPAAGRWSVQAVLVGLGVLLLAVAAVIFLVLSWDRLSLAARAVVIAVLTAAALLAAARTRPRLPDTAQALGALATALVLADAWAVRATGLGRADRLDPALFAALAGACCAVLLGTWGWTQRLRAGSLAAVALAPLSLVAAGGWGARSADSPAPLLAGVLAAAALTAGRRRIGSPWAAERSLLRALAVLGLLTGLAIAIDVTAADQAVTSRLWAAGGFLLGAAVAALQAWTDRPRAGRGSPLPWTGAWSAAAGLWLALVALPVTGAVVDPRWVPRGAVPDAWPLALLPAGSLAVAAVLSRARRRAAGTGLTATTGVDLLAAGRAAGWTGLALTLPAAIATALGTARAATAGVPPWRARAGTLLGELPVGRPGHGEVSATRVALHLAGILGLVAAGLLLRWSRDRLWTPWLAGALGLAAVAVPALPAAPVWLAVAGWGVGAGLAAAAALRLLRRPVRRRLLLAVTSAAVVLAVLVSWAWQPLSVPLTLAGAAAAYLALAAVPARWRLLPLLVAAVGGAVAVAGVVAQLHRPIPDRAVAVVVVLTLLSGASASLGTAGGEAPLRLAAPPRALRAHAAAALALPVAVALPVAWVAVADSASRSPRAATDAAVRVLCLLGALASAAAAVWTRRAGDHPAGPAAAAVAAAVSGPALVALAASPFQGGRPLIPAHALPEVLGAHPGTLPAAVAVLLGAALLARLGQRVPADPRRRPAEAGLAVAGAAVLVAAVAGPPRQLWVALLLVGAAAAALATAPDRRRLWWVSLALLTLSSWSRLAQADVGLVEAYTVPTALVLLAVAGLRLRRRPPGEPAEVAVVWRALRPGLTLLLLPSALAGAEGTPLRPAALLVAAVTATVASLWCGPVTAVVLARVAAATAVVTGAVRSLAGLGPLAPSWTEVELWAEPAAAVLAVTAFRWRPSGTLAAVWPRWAAALALGGGLPLLAALPGGAPAVAGWRCAAVFAVAAGVAVAAEWRTPADRAAAEAPDAPAPDADSASDAAPATGGSPLGDRGLVPVAAGLALAAAAAGALAGPGPGDAWSLAAGVLLAVLGAVTLQARPAVRSWAALGPGLALAVLPSLLLAVTEPRLWRILLVAVLGAGLTLAGARWRLRAPVGFGAVTLAAHAVLQLGPWLAGVVAAAPRWAVLAALGALLLWVGATYERRLGALREARQRVAALR